MAHVEEAIARLDGFRLRGIDAVELAGAHDPEHNVGEVAGVRTNLVVGDLPFGSYQESPQQAFASAARLMKEGRAHAVKLEGGAHMAPTVEHLAKNGIPVVAHIGFTPQSVNTLGGFRVQGRGGADERAVVLPARLDAALAPPGSRATLRLVGGGEGEKP